MAKAQGDGFKTWTDVEINKKVAKSNELVKKLINEQEKIQRVNDLTIVCVQGNIVENKSRCSNLTSMEWQVVGKRYYIYLFQDYKTQNAEVLTHRVIENDVNKANEAFKEILELAKIG